MKGRNNYLCRKKLYDLTDQPVLSGLEEIEQYRAIAAWEKTTSTGDRAELAELPEASALWHKLDARSEACIGQKCSEWERCFVTEMRRRGMESDIIIVNHHLFFADLAIKLQADGAPDAGILPEAAAVIFDEAHELEDVAGNYFGISVSNLRVDDLARDVEASLQHNRMLSASLSGALGSLRERSQLLFAVTARRRAVCLRDASPVSGGKWRRIPRAQPGADQAGGGTGRPAPEARRDFQLRAASPGAPGAARLRHGVGRSQYCLLDRAARRPGKGEFTTEKPRYRENRKTECLPAGNSY
jgi:hypothetical protein